MKPCNSVKVRHVMVKPVYRVTEYTIHSLLITCTSTMRFNKSCYPEFVNPIL